MISSALWGKTWPYSIFKTNSALAFMKTTPALPLRMPTLTNLTSARPSYATCTKLPATSAAVINLSFKLTSFCTMCFVSLRLKLTACWSSSPWKRKKNLASSMPWTSAKPWQWETTRDSSSYTKKPPTWLGLWLTFLLTNCVFCVCRSSSLLLSCLALRSNT